ncbi:MAG: hypothetical protein NTY22_09990 [Proteobacteria bacterium]|nr:hypothetical protein [Pseudomonadota bacterium]
MMNLIIIFFMTFLFSRQALAVCPVCTIAVGSGLGLLRAFGVDDIITGLWLGALVVSSILWFLDWMNKRNYNFKFKKTIIWISFYLLFIYPLYLMGYGGEPMFYFVDRLLIGVIIGSIVFLLSIAADHYLRSINDNKVVFLYQKVIVPMVFLFIASIVTHLVVQII